MAAEPQSDLAEHQTYQGRTLICDVVMKGGITSGVTYPLAVCEIAKTYKLHNVGGSSAGAIAAATAAAAEVGRSVPGAGFARLAELPGRLSKHVPGTDDSVLFSVFQPQPVTRRYFAILSAALHATGGGLGRVVRKVGSAVIAAAWPFALLGASLGIGLLALVLVVIGTRPAIRGDGLALAELVVAGLAAVVLMAIGAVGGALFGLGRGALRDLRTNGFGLCSGSGDERPCPPDADCPPDLQPGPGGRLQAKPLTIWLADEIDALAGRSTPDGPPLTLGDLAASKIRLQMFTTNLSDGTPYTLPFRSRQFFFLPAELSSLFPKRVVKHMVDSAPKPLDQREAELFQRLKEQHDLRPFPSAADLPVVVAARMSLSFPVLLSAVPLWTLDWTETPPVPRRCWFSDGGITSNFPIHFFDGPIPRWPTFGLDLGPFPPGTSPDPVEANNISAPLTNRVGILTRYTSIASVFDFGRALFDTMQNWMDNAQAHMPGYRDRIVLIRHTRQEGGLNLNMPEPLITAFAERGRAAGRFLVNRFAHMPSANEHDELSWENHRWLRYRSSMAVLEGIAAQLVRGYDYPPLPQWARTYSDLIEGPLQATPSYHLTQAQQGRAVDLTAGLMDLCRGWRGPGLVGTQDEPEVDLSRPLAEATFDSDQPFLYRAPHPVPVMRITRDF